MKMVERGASRQDGHEEIRVLSHQAAAVVKGEGKPNDLLQRIRNTEYFKPVHADLDAMLDPKLYVGRSGVIVERFCADVAKKLEKYKEYLDKAQTAELYLEGGGQKVQSRKKIESEVMNKRGLGKIDAGLGVLYRCRHQGILTHSTRRLRIGLHN